MRIVNLLIKGIFDVVFSACLSIVLLPWWVLIAVLIKLTMPGPVFFKQVRAGKNGEEFEILKFRTMRVDVEAEKAFDVSKDTDRLTVLGSVLRRLKLDETPQLLNVLKRDMSCVGPRPTFKSQVEEYDDFQRRRLEMLPGMTGLAQTNGNVSLTWDDRILYDVYYIDHFSILLDLKILMKTVFIVLFGEDRFRRLPMNVER
ncbi:sugar transferase [Adlercreutzia sp. ZJ141]|uniref:sugar transferase n=1 Tax=Adlercreutzia sp. ZJ141 TaxID=2709406 RepID=UPI0013ED6D34|nr:sugar transferase [Adlercreutzia sp. ZJ141]